ncbi:hypothetical protein [Emticicia sp. TH156]|uniref:hypothetical protein n=1 Tax=Emticicia sp. TH156 TaxID=2067454 RepID=UPI000C786E03|nr:hypothetical protein [Emticicia sp. TH156]PLK46179.1 hypothetical protein C0V77_02185 [Emticicia sp. TH156]
MKKYIPNLISKEYKILPDYFKESSLEKKSNPLDVFKSALAIIFFFFSFVTIAIHFIFSLLLFLIGFIILPWGSSFLEKKVRFDFTTSLKLKVIGFISIFTIFTGDQFFDTIAEINERNRKVELKSIAEQQAINKTERLRKDSLGFYISYAHLYQKQKKYKKAINQLVNAQKFARNSEIDLIYIGLAEAYFEDKNFKKANENYDKLSNTNSEIYYKKGICNNKIGNIRIALANFKRASELGSENADKEYNKLNPMIKYVVDYRTLCCDGTFSPSNAKGRGACSHHGGVCNWNSPVYETRRKYEISNF